MKELILIEEHKKGCIIWLNRPEKKNAINKELLESLDAAIAKIKKEQFRFVMFTSKIDDCFCAGADLSERLTMNEEQTLSFVYKIQEVFNKIASIHCPTIAALNGYAFGGGLELALACDIRVAKENIRLGLSECSLGVIPGAGGTARLVSLIGYGKACDLIFTAKKITAATAKEIGLLQDVISNDEWDSYLLSYVQKIANNAPIAIQAAKKSLQYNQKLQEALSFEHQCYKDIISSKDRMEGLIAFKEKRQANFIGE